MSKQNLINKLTQMAIDYREYNIHIFVHYSAHVDEISTRVFKDGWEDDKDPDLVNGVYLNDDNAAKKLEQLIESIEKMCKEKGSPAMFEGTYLCNDCHAKFIITVFRKSMCRISEVIYCPECGSIEFYEQEKEV